MVRAVDDTDLCVRFQNLQSNVFYSRFGTKEFSSLKIDWSQNENVYVFYATRIDSDEILGGFRVHISDKAHALPVEVGIGSDDERIYDIVDDLAKTGCAEICALWMSKEGFSYGLEAIDLLRGAIYLCHKKNIENVLSLVGPTSINFVEFYGAEIFTKIGNKGAFHYPNENFEFYVSNVKISVVRDLVDNSEKEILTELYDNPYCKFVSEKRGKPKTLIYDLEK